MNDKDKLREILGPSFEIVITDEMINEIAKEGANIILRGFDEEYRGVDKETIGTMQEYDIEEDVLGPFMEKIEDAIHRAIGKRVMEILESDQD